MQASPLYSRSLLSAEAVVLQSARTDGRHWRQPFCFSFVRSHVFKSPFIVEAVVMVHEVFDRSPPPHRPAPAGAAPRLAGVPLKLPQSRSAVVEDERRRSAD